jgi:hypothetical protein
VEAYFYTLVVSIEMISLGLKIGRVAKFLFLISEANMTATEKAVSSYSVFYMPFTIVDLKSDFYNVVHVLMNLVFARTHQNACR